jgi:hypothetical protein
MALKDSMPRPFIRATRQRRRLPPAAGTVALIIGSTAIAAAGRKV